MEVAAVGSSEFTLGFELVGIRSHNYTKPEEIKSLEQERIGVIIIDDKTMNRLDEFSRKEFEDSLRPLFVVLSEAETQENIAKLIKRSIGIEL
ncbi:hypothetical protein HYU15_01840 [Candidatus Woesearchaeota archaeon]|nr:hypothetical protein [Candidatus Woesearchaeota archaeon]